MGNVSKRFLDKKRVILDSLSRSADQYSDSSPKGSIDEGIIDLINLINGIDGLVTTSSCAGRLAVFQEGEKVEKPALDSNGQSVGLASLTFPSGKGGGKWLFVSHCPISYSEGQLCQKFQIATAVIGEKYINDEELGLGASTRFIKLQFEPLILHIATASMNHAQMVLSAALNAGFRESGIQSIKSLNSDGDSLPIVAVRTTGLSLGAVIGFVDQRTGVNQSLVSETYLRTMVMLANTRFAANRQRTERFRNALEIEQAKSNESTEHESKASRAARKRQEGLKRQQRIRSSIREPEVAVQSVRTEHNCECDLEGDNGDKYNFEYHNFS